MRRWLSELSPRDQAIYAILLAVLLVIIGLYLVMGIQFLAQTGTPAPVVATFTPTATLTHTPTHTPAATPTHTPGATPTHTPGSVPTNTVPISPTGTLTATVTVTVTMLPHTPRPAPTDTNTPTNTPVLPAPTDTPAPPTPIPPTPIPLPTSPDTPVPPISQEYLMLYFADATGTLLVPVVRISQVEAKQVATAAMRELIAGPPPDLRRLVPADVNILSMQREGDMIIANVDRQPGGEQSLRAIALTLTEFPGVTRVQMLVNGVPVGIGGNNAPIYRPVLNVDNPYGLPTTFESGTRFLPLYFLGAQGNYIRITRLVPETLETARKTVEELLAGPGQYSDILSRPIPAGTQLRDIAKGENNSVIVDLSHHFASADNRDAALQTLVLSLTELRGSGSTPIFRRVQVRVEGRALSEYWGNGYTGPFERILLNAE